MRKTIEFILLASVCCFGADLSTQFSRSSALTCARISHAAYGPQSDSTIAALGIPLVKFLNDSRTNTRGFILADSAFIVVSMKGTDDLKSTLVDAAFFQAGYPYEGFLSRFFEFLLFFIAKEKVHAGFIASYATVRHDVVSTVSTLLKQKKRYVFVTGHSLGGALATLAAYDIASTCRADACLYTFGGPRVGNPVFEKKFDALVKNAYRVKNYDDVVPCVPMEKLEFKNRVIEYRHVGTLRQLDTNGQFIATEICPDKSRILEELATGSPIKSHDIVGYIERLGQ